MQTHPFPAGHNDYRHFRKLLITGFGLEKVHPPDAFNDLLRGIGDRQAFDLRSLFEEGIPLADFPVLEMLVEGGLASLFGSASRQGFLPDPEGYVSACHLCVHLRTWLFCRLPGEQRPKELAPDFFYEEMRRLAGL